MVIPVWNGGEVIAGCLDALYAHSGPRLAGVIAVDNGSPDDSAAQIARSYPQVQLLRSGFNLGFAGGVNLGIQAAGSEDVVLLNQDCLVEAGWLEALCAGLAGDAQAAIAGCTILNADGTVNHAGAQLEMPLAYSHHLTTVTEQPTRVEYVTGAVFAIRRRAWEALGPLDADYYPAYYEEADYCWRARRHGWSVLYVPQARVRHLQSSRAWRADPLLHWTQQHRSRYRFVAKHYADDDLAAFFAAEEAAIAAEPWFDQALGRALAARHTLRGLEGIRRRRQQELESDLPLAMQRRLEVGLAGLAQAALRRAQWYVRNDLTARELERRSAGWPQRLVQQIDKLLQGRIFAASSVHTDIQRAAQSYVLALLAEYEYA